MSLLDTFCSRQIELKSVEKSSVYDPNLFLPVAPMASQAPATIKQNLKKDI